MGGQHALISAGIHRERAAEFSLGSLVGRRNTAFFSIACSEIPVGAVVYRRGGVPCPEFQTELEGLKSCHSMTHGQLRIFCRIGLTAVLWPHFR